MFDIGITELLVLCVVGLIVIGPARLPEVANQLGRIYGVFRRLRFGMDNELRRTFDNARITAEFADVVEETVTTVQESVKQPDSATHAPSNHGQYDQRAKQHVVQQTDK